MFEGSKLDILTCSQLINEPIHWLDSSSSFIDVTFTSQTNLVMESGVQPSLHPNCHHQLVFARFDISIYYLPLYERTVCYYKRANSDLIQRPIELFNWDKELRINHVDKQIIFFQRNLDEYITKNCSQWNYRMWWQRAPVDKWNFTSYQSV